MIELVSLHSVRHGRRQATSETRKGERGRKRGGRVNERLRNDVDLPTAMSGWAREDGQTRPAVYSRVEVRTRPLTNLVTIQAE